MTRFTGPAAPVPEEDDAVTESEWLACADPTLMLEYLLGKASDRKLRLFAVACCRLIEPFIRHEGYHRAVEAAEGFADGRVAVESLSQARAAAWATCEEAVWKAGDWVGRACQAVADPSAASAAATAAVAVAAYDGPEASPGYRAASARQAELLRCIAGNPSRPAADDPAWLTSTSASLARAIYAERAFDRLPILADALEEAGCDDADVLAHCRGDGPHARGCWALDLVLGKE
jgi:hypothetical protein